MVKHLIPIQEVCSRHTSFKFKPRTNYPLNTNYETNYNYPNLLESMHLWNLYSNDENVCLEQAMKLMDLVLENGDKHQVSNAVNTVKSAVKTLNDPKAAQPMVQKGVQKAVTKVAKEAYQSLEKECRKAIEENRIIQNHDLISRRFAVDRHVREDTLTQDDIPYTIYEICSFIDSYNFGVDSKYKVALEESLYALARNNIDVTQEQLVESVTDYFVTNIMHKKDTKGKLYNIMESVLNKNWFVKNTGYPARLKSMLENFDYNEFKEPKFYSGFNFSNADIKSITEAGEPDLSKVAQKFKPELNKIANKWNYTSITTGSNWKEAYDRASNGLQKQGKYLVDIITNPEKETIEPEFDNEVRKAFKKIKADGIHLSFQRESADKNNGYYVLMIILSHSHPVEESMSMLQERIVQEIFDDSPVNKHAQKIAEMISKLALKHGVERYAKDTFLRIKWRELNREHPLGIYYVPENVRDRRGTISSFVNDVKSEFSKANFEGVELHSKVQEHYAKFTITNVYQMAPHEESAFLLESEKKKGGRIQAVVDAFKAAPTKTKAGLQKIIDTVFIVNRDQDIIHDTKNILSLIFYFTVFANALAIGVLPGILAALTLKIINFNLERRYMDRVLKTWYAHRDSVHHKMEKCKDEKKKEEYEKYLKEIDKNIEDLEYHSDKMRGEDEKKSEDKRPKGYTKKDEFDLDFGGTEDWDVNFDGDFKEAAIDLKLMENCLESIHWDKKDVENRLFVIESVENMNSEDFEYLTEFAIKYPDMLSQNKLLDAAKWKGRLLNESNTDPLYIERSSLSETEQKLRKSIEKEKEKIAQKPIEQKLPEDEDTTKEVIKELNELYYYTTNINNHLGLGYFQELSIGSHLKIAADKLMSIASGLSDKEQMISRQLDGTVKYLQRSIEKAMSMENREAVIRGDILPSLSKCIKWALLIGGAAFINVGLAAIILVWKVAMSNKIRTKEKQMILDELEVESKMVDHYISDAEAKHDYKKLREYMLIKKKLKHQNDRLRWNIKVTWKDNGIDDSKGGNPYNGHPGQA